MKLIVAIIRSEKLETVQSVLKNGETRILSMSCVEDAAGGRTGTYRGEEIRFSRPTLRLEIAAEDWCAETVAAEIVAAVSPANALSGDGDSVFMMPLESCAPPIRCEGTPPLRDRQRLMTRPLPYSCPW